MFSFACAFSILIVEMNMRVNYLLKNLHRKLNGSTLEYNLAPYRQLYHKICDREADLKQLSDDLLRTMAYRLKADAAQSSSVRDLVVETFALIREVAWRTITMRPFDVQVIGGIVMHNGKLAEMQTGEGKTLTAVLPATLNALFGNGVHVLTFNDYLARRDAEWMRPIYEFFGLRVGCVQEGMSIAERQLAYLADITYLTAKEAGFDYLRDKMCYDHANVVQRPYHLAIIDEADSILIDEARIPLVIAGNADDFIPDTYHYAAIARSLKQADDFQFDEYARNILLTDNGVAALEQKLDITNLYDEKNVDQLARIHCAIHAEYLLHRDVDYIVRNGRIELVDEFTGRVADKRRWPDGLQAALEAKENLPGQSSGRIFNSITLQHFMQLYPKRCGMTATAQAADDEFHQFYNLDIVVIPPNKPCARIDFDDVIFRTTHEKNRAIIDEIKHVNEIKRPVLVGTRSVDESAHLAGMLNNEGIVCEVLNAKRDEHEARIIADAGKPGAVTISTNMAGRGTDIVLGGADANAGEFVRLVGGLYVIGTNKHESRRIDDQLRGRAGRQGDPGSSRFFISLEDDLMMKYGVEQLIPTDVLAECKHGRIENQIVCNEINRIQRIVDGQNFDIKIMLTKYSSLIEKQRQFIYEKRTEAFYGNMASDFFRERAADIFDAIEKKCSPEHVDTVCRQLFLFFIDHHWANYLNMINDVREGIHLRSLGGQEPIIEFNKIARDGFAELLSQIESDCVSTFNRLKDSDEKFDWESLGIKTPSATWTYLVTDKLFENILGIQMIGNIGISVGAGLYWPLMLLFSAFRKIKTKWMGR
jgi:preprotein translocase subunit SecA